jgi:16S rRNA processing protein RimM
VEGADILMGVVGRPHGVRGLVHVRSYTADPAALADYAPLTDERGREWRLAWRGDGVAELRDAAGRALPDRNAAEALVNLRLFVARSQLPRAAEDEFYLADLIGMEVRLGGAAAGRVAAVHDYGAGTSLEIERADAPPLLVPFTREAVPAIDVAGRWLEAVPLPENEARAA